MAILTLEDYSGRFPVIVFPKTYREALRYVMQDSIVAIEGRLSVDERESKIIAMQVQKLEAKPQQGIEGRAVHLKVEPYLDNALTQRQLMNVFANFKGKDVVYLHLMGARKVIKTTPNFWIDLDNPGLIPALEKVLGPNCLLKK